VRISFFSEEVEVDYIPGSVGVSPNATNFSGFD